MPPGSFSTGGEWVHSIHVAFANVVPEPASWSLVFGALALARGAGAAEPADAPDVKKPLQGSGLEACAARGAPITSRSAPCPRRP